LETNGKSGLLYKSDEENANSFGLVKEGYKYLCWDKDKMQAVEPILGLGLGLLQFPRTSRYRPTIGANLNPSRIAGVPYNSGVEDFGRMPSEIEVRVMDAYDMGAMHKIIARLSPASSRTLMAKGLQLVEEKEVFLAQQEEQRRRQEADDRERRRALQQLLNDQRAQQTRDRRKQRASKVSTDHDLTGSSFLSLDYMLIFHQNPNQQALQPLNPNRARNPTNAGGLMSLGTHDSYKPDHFSNTGRASTFDSGYGSGRYYDQEIDSRGEARPRDCEDRYGGNRYNQQWDQENDRRREPRTRDLDQVCYESNDYDRSWDLNDRNRIGRSNNSEPELL
jgi:hypothetical protein